MTWSLDPESADEELFEVNGGRLTFKSPPDYEVPEDSDEDNVYNVTVIASDGRTGPGDTRQDVVVRVINVDEQGDVTLSTLQPQVDVPITATLTDPDGAASDDPPIGDTDLTDDDNVEWQWARASRAAGPWTDINGATEETYTPKVVDAEDDEDDVNDVGVYLRVTATYDDGHCPSCDTKKTEQAISANAVRAKPYVNAPPVFKDEQGKDISTTTRSVAENSPAGTAVGAPVTATDPGVDGTQEILTYTLGTENDNGLFNIDHATGQIKVKTALDYEDEANVNRQYTIEVTVRDPSGEDDSIDVTVMVTNVDEDPELMDGGTTEDYEENTPIDTVVYTYMATDEEGDAETLKWSLSGRDAGKFAIGNRNGNDNGVRNRGNLSFRESPDYEDPTDSGRDNVYNLTVTVTDRGGNTATKDVTVTVTNENEVGWFTLSSLNPRVGVKITPDLTDPDGHITNETWTWEINGTPQSPSPTYTPKTANDTDLLQVRVEYDDGTGGRKCLPDCNVYMRVNNIAPKKQGANQSPRFSNTDRKRTVQENAEAETEVGGRVIANDDDTDLLTYSISGNDAVYFIIDQGTGQITTRGVLDREKEDNYRVTVAAVDPSGLKGTHNLTIEVTDVDEDAEITSGYGTVYYEENGTGTVATYRAEDPEEKSIVWTLDGADKSVFLHQFRRRTDFR